MKNNLLTTATVIASLALSQSALAEENNTQPSECVNGVSIHTLAEIQEHLAAIGAANNFSVEFDGIAGHIPRGVSIEEIIRSGEQESNASDALLDEAGRIAFDTEFDTFLRDVDHVLNNGGEDANASDGDAESPDTNASEQNQTIEIPSPQNVIDWALEAIRLLLLKGIVCASNTADQ